MPVTLDSTVGGPTSNSYGSLAEAEAYFASRLYADAWTSVLSDDVKRQALITATHRLEELPWRGTPTAIAQRLAWPMIGEIDLRGDLVRSNEIPEAVKIAQFETALDLLAVGKDPGATDPLANFAALKVGPIAIQLRDTAPRTADTLRPAVWRLVGHWLDFTSGADFSRG